MAKGKKSFVLYSDQKELFEHLSNEQAGKLIKHIFKYVNDENPTCEDPIVNLAFITIKAALKRDLASWEEKLKQRSEAGKKSAAKRKATKSNESQRALTSVESRARNSTDNVNDNVNVNVNVNVNDNEIKKEKVFNFRLSLINLGVEEKVAEDWMKVRKTKKATNTETAFNRIKSQIEKSGVNPNDCIKLAVVKDWKGFEAEWINKEQNLKQETDSQFVYVNGVKMLKCI
jgi:hypothetical protein